MKITTETRFIDEIRSITANAVAKKQDAAKLNFPSIKLGIEEYAKKGKSFRLISQYGINEYDKQILEAEGFTVILTNLPADHSYEQLARISGRSLSNFKVWKISW